MIIINMVSMYLTTINPIPGLFLLTFSAMVHLPFSLGYHIFMPMSEETFIQWRKLDVTFIFIASIFLSVSLGYYIFPPSILVILLAFTVIVAYEGITNFNKHSNQAKINHVKHSYLISTIIVCYMFPVLYKLCYDLFILQQLTNSVVYGFCLIGTLFICGYAFATEWPQRLYPGKLDLIGNSHNIVHITASLAHILEYLFILENSKL